MAPLNLGADPFYVGQQPGASSGAAGPSGPQVNLGADAFLVNYDSTRPGGGGAGGESGPDIIEVQIRKAEGLPHQQLKANKRASPICVCQVVNKPSARVQTGACSNRSPTDPIWGRDPDYYRAHLENWEEGDTLTFTIQDEDATSSRVIGKAELTYEQYKNGYEWWLPLEVAKMKSAPEGWPYAAVQVKIQFVQGIRITAADPFLSNVTLGQPKSRGWCSCCFGPWMWCSRRCKVCALTCRVKCKWSCVMSGLACVWCCMQCCLLNSMVYSWCSGKESLAALRRDCAKRFKLPDADDDGDDEEGPGDVACCCVPLRTAVFLMSVFSTINALLAFFFPRFLSSGQSAMGGYSVPSRVVVGATQVTGVFFGPIGCLGASELNVSLLNTYNYYQLLRLSGMFFMLYQDIPLLSDCNVWRTDLNGAIKKYGWNPQMYNVAMGNTCLQTQIDFVLTAFFTIIIYTYLISLTRRLIWTTEATPKYLLSMPQDTPNGSFVKSCRTQGRAKPPYGAIYGTAAPMGPKGKLEATGPMGRQGPGLVGQPMMMPPGMMPPGGMRPGAMPMGGPGGMPPQFGGASGRPQMPSGFQY